MDTTWKTCVVSALVLCGILGLSAAGPEKHLGKRADKQAAPEPVEVRLNDRSVMKVMLREERLALETPYGKLLIPVKDIRKIDFGLRISPEERKKIETAVMDLGHAERARRQTATTELLALKEKAFGAVLAASKSKDLDISANAQQIADKIRETVAPDILALPAFDMVHTIDSQIAGQIAGSTLCIGTLAFGEQQLKLSDIRSLSSTIRRKESVVLDALPDPGSLTGYQQQVGKTVLFKVMPTGQGAVYGTDIYTLDTNLAMAAVHAGLARMGQTSVVRVTILGQQPGFAGSVRNGVASQNYGGWPGFRIEPP